MNKSRIVQVQTTLVGAAEGAGSTRTNAEGTLSGNVTQSTGSSTSAASPQRVLIGSTSL